MIPVADFTSRRLKPYVNWTLIAINIAVFAYMLTLNGGESVRIPGFGLGTERDKFLFDYGFVSACLGQEAGLNVGRTARELAVCPSGQKEFLQVFTSMFVHANLLHIAGNMLFLWIFGDNIEDRLGHWRYLGFYLVCGIAAALTQTALSLDTLLPSVGASGAIAGVLGAYLLLYPFGLVEVYIPPIFLLPVPAIVPIGMWFLSQLIAGVGELGQSTTGSGIAWWAHVGGFVTGVILIWLFRRRRGWRQGGATG